MAIIDKPSDYFRCKLYSGNNNTQNIVWDETDTNMKPDMLWIKSIAGNTVFEHVLGNVISGNQKYLVPNSTAAQVSNGNVINTFNTNGFSVGGATQVSEGGRSYASWGWKASNTTASNTTGSINSTVSVSTNSRFSVVSYTGNQTSGATVGHGLGAVPAMFMVKNLNDAEAWQVYHKDLTSASYHLVLNERDAEASNTSRWNGAAPTSSVFTLGNNDTVNNVNIPYIAFCFADSLVSKFGTYVGTGNASGPYIHLGFKPAIIMIKSRSSSSTWHLADNKRAGYNPRNYRIQPNDANAQYTGSEINTDFLAQGFKLRNTDTDTNGGGPTYIYLAFAENPFVTSTDNNSIPTTAR